MTLPRDTYSGPVLAGQRWRQRGLSGHGTYLVTVLRMASRSVQLVVEGGGSGAGSSQASRAGRSGKIHVGKRYNVPLDIFRSNYVLVSQPKGYKAPTPLDVALGQVARHPAERLTSTRLEDLYSHSALQNDPTPRECLDEQIDAFASILDHPAPPAETSETPEEAATDVPETETETEASTTQEALRDPGDPEGDPLDAFVEQGRQVVQRLTEALSVVEGERTRLEVTLDALLRDEARLRNRRDRAERGVLAALAAMEEDPEVPPSPPPGLDDYSAADRNAALADRSVTTGQRPHAGVMRALGAGRDPSAPPEGVDPEGGTPEGEDPLGPRPTGQGRVSQRAWIEGYLRGAPARQAEVRVADIARGFAEEFGFDFDRARMNISAILVENNKRIAPAAHLAGDGQGGERACTVHRWLRRTPATSPPVGRRGSTQPACSRRRSWPAVACRDRAAGRPRSGHHRDGAVPRTTTPTNVVFVCRPCHARLHTTRTHCIGGATSSPENTVRHPHRRAAVPGVSALRRLAWRRQPDRAQGQARAGRNRANLDISRCVDRCVPSRSPRSIAPWPGSGCSFLRRPHQRPAVPHAVHQAPQTVPGGEGLAGHVHVARRGGAADAGQQAVDGGVRQFLTLGTTLR